MGAISAADARVVAMYINQCPKLAVTATNVQRAIIVQSGTPTCSASTPEKWPIKAALRMKGTASDATKNCMSNGEPVPATARLPIIMNAMLIAATSGSNATQPSSVTLGRMINSTPPKATKMATHFVAWIRSWRKIALKIAVIMGLVKPMAVASAKGIRKIDEKKQMVATATENPRNHCNLGMGIAKPRHPSFRNNKVPSPMAPIE